MEIKDENIESSEHTQDGESPMSSKEPSQLELITRWRTALSCLMNDVKFNTRVLRQNERLISVRECIDYLDKKNTLLDENDDVQLSETGLSVYKSKHMEVFSYLSNLSKCAIPLISSKLYFVNIVEHFKQQKIPSQWRHFLIHFLLIPLACIVFFWLGSLAVKQTQNNMVVNILFFLCLTSQFSVIPGLFQKIKKDVATPFKFKVSLLAIHLLNSLQKLFWICLFPIYLVNKIQPYWVDDVIIISLIIYYFVLCSGALFFEPELSKDSSKEGIKNV